jgi:hypothetical protein
VLFGRAKHVQKMKSGMDGYISIECSECSRTLILS